MLSQYKTIQKKINQEISNVKTQSMFQGNSPLMQSEVQSKLDLNKSLKQAEKYGHKLNHKHFPNAANTTVVQPKMGLENSSSQVIQAFKLPPWLKNKKVDQGAKTSDLGSSISSTIADTAKNVNEAASGGMGGVLKVGAVATDARDTITAIQEGNKLGAAASGTKFLAGGTESGANMAKFAGEAVSSTGVGLAGGIGGTVSGAVDTAKGAHNLRQSRKGYHSIKDVARNAAEKIEPSQPGNKPRSTKELAQVQEMVPQKVQEQQQKMAANNQQIKAKKREFKQAKDPKEKARLKGEIKSLKEANRPSTQEMNNLRKQGDVLQVAQYAAKTQSKTTKREGIHTASGVGQTVGGSLAIAGTAGAGIGAVPGAAVSMTAAGLKPAAYLTRKSKQVGRDKGLPGFNQDKTSDKKNAERAEIAEKLTKRSQDPQMQTIFANLPGVSQDDMTRFQGSQVSPDEASQVLKRRHY